MLKRVAAKADTETETVELLPKSALRQMSISQFSGLPKSNRGDVEASLNRLEEANEGEPRDVEAGPT